jgi:hypothetical protein
MFKKIIIALFGLLYIGTIIFIESVIFDTYSNPYWGSFRFALLPLIYCYLFIYLPITKPLKVPNKAFIFFLIVETITLLTISFSVPVIIMGTQSINYIPLFAGACLIFISGNHYFAYKSKKLSYIFAVPLILISSIPIYFFTRIFIILNF